jgi:hypothetical protein
MRRNQRVCLRARAPCGYQSRMFAREKREITAGFGRNEEPLHAVAIVVEREADLANLIERFVTARVACAAADINESPALT